MIKNKLIEDLKEINRMLSLLITVGCYILFFGLVSLADGNESNNSFIAAGTLVAMTFFINFPVAWWGIHQLIKSVRKNKNNG